MASHFGDCRNASVPRSQRRIRLRRKRRVESKHLKNAQKIDDLEDQTRIFIEPLFWGCCSFQEAAPFKVHSIPSQDETPQRAAVGLLLFQQLIPTKFKGRDSEVSFFHERSTKCFFPCEENEPHFLCLKGIKLQIPNHSLL